MKILLTGINSKYIHSNLAIRYLKAYTKDLDAECIIREYTINDRMENILESIIKEKADVVAFSCYIWNMEYVNQLSKLIKLVDENIEILYGGPEVSFDSTAVLEENPGEYVISGEGEETFRDFVLYKLNQKEINRIKGLTYRNKDGEIINNGIRENMNMENLVFPYEEDENLDNKIVYYEASRGCPFGCKYCLSSTEHRVRFLDIERVKKELMYFINKKVKLVKFVDRTFNCRHDFSMAIWKFLIDQDTETKFHFELSADLLSDDEIALLNTAPKNRFQFEVGVQTTNEQVLKNIHRYVKFDRLKSKVLGIERGKNIDQHLDLIVGLPGEDYKSFRNSFNDVYSLRPEVVQIGFLKLLKGAAMRDEAKQWGMKYSPYAPYEVLRTNCVSYDEIVELKKVDEMVDKYYNSGKFKNIVNYLLPKFETPFDFYLALARFYDEKGYFNKSIGNVEYYNVFHEFNMSELNGEYQDIFDEIIKYDYLMFNKKRWLPPFLKRHLEKEEEREIKEDLRGNEPFKRMHIEKYSINMKEYLEKGSIKNEYYYLIYDEDTAEKVEYKKNI